MKRSRWILSAVVIAVLIAATYVTVHRLETPAESAHPAPVREPGVVRFPAGAPQLSAIKVAAAEEAPLPLAEPMNGRIAYNEDATARVSSPIAGRIVALKAQPGDVVKAGDALAQLDSPDLAAAVADVEKAAADERVKKLAFERAERLVDGGVAPRKDLENADSDLAQARAESERARLKLRNYGPRAIGSGFALRAPIGGVVADRKANPGLEVRPDLADPLYVITDPRRLWVLVDLPERAVGKVAVGNRVAVEVDAYPGERFDAVVQRIGEVVDPATRRVQLRGAIANPDRKLKPEMYARVTLLAAEGQRAVRVPNTALVTEGLYSFVFVQKAEGVFERRRVSLAFQDRDASYVAAGLAAGENIVTGGALLLNSELQDGS